MSEGQTPDSGTSPLALGTNWRLRNGNLREGGYFRGQALQIGNLLSSFLAGLEEPRSQTLRNPDFLTLCYLKEYKELILVVSLQLIFWYLYLSFCSCRSRKHHERSKYFTTQCKPDS